MEAKELRRKILQMSHKAGACHIGSALSCVEIVLAMNKMEGTKLFSKASGAATVYALAGKNWKYLKENPLLWPGGSLGHGLPIAVGMALGNRKQKVYVLISDAELQEGTFWESMNFANHHKLNNLVVIVDWNKIQACGYAKDICELRLKVENIIDGHNIDKLEKAFNTKHKFFPVLIFADTIKGKGVSFMEDNYEWHYKNLGETELRIALKENI